MKKSLLVLAAIAAAVSCAPKAGQVCKIVGTAADSLATIEGAFVEISEPAGQKDTLAIVNGKFEGVVPSCTECLRTARLVYPDMPRRMLSHRVSFISDAKKVMITLADSSFVNGSPLTDAYNALGAKIADIRNNLYDKAVALAKGGNEAAGDSVYAVMQSQIKEASLEAFAANTDNAIAPVAIKNVIYELSCDELDSLVNIGGDVVKNDERITRMLTMKKAEKNTAEGCAFVDFSGKDAAGNAIKLSDFVGKGNYVLIDFWASWCGPCMRAMPELRETFEKYSPKGVKVIGVNVWENNAEDGPKCVKDKNMTWDIFYVEGKDATDSYGVNGIPEAVIFGPDGKIVKRGHPMEIKPAEFFATIF